jgi:hypothetical protein
VDHVRAFLALALCAALLAAGCGEDDESGGGGFRPLVDLTVSLDPDGDGPEPAKQATVRCGSAAESERCEQVAALRPADFEPVPDDVACTQQFGGPQVAEVTGTLRRSPVDARFSRQDGCEIARWEKARPLLEAAA